MSEIKWTSSAWGFRQTPLAEQCKWLKGAGINYICGQCYAGAKGLFDQNISDQEIIEAKKFVDSFGLSYASFNADGDFMVEKDVAKEIDLCCSRIDIGAKFEPKVIIVFAGWQQRTDDGVYKQVSSALKQVAQHAAKYKLKLALENHGGLTTTAEQINRILDDVKEPNIGVNYDPANFYMYGQDPYKALLDLRHPVIFTHLKSVKKVDGKKVYCRVSEGEIDDVPIFRHLKKTYDGFYGLEYEEPSDVFAGSDDDFKTLKNLIQKLG